MRQRGRTVVGIVVALVVGAALWAFVRRGGVEATVTARVALAGGGEARRVVITTSSGTRVEAVVVRFDRRRVRAEFAELSRDPTVHVDVAAVRAERGAVVAINGGYFDGAFQPVGLRLMDGVETSARSDERRLSGFLVADADGLLDVAMSASGARWAMQSGPVLIDPGGAVGIHQTRDAPAARRTVVAVDAADGLAVVTTTDVTLFDLAQALHDRAEAFGLGRVERALNLDGGPSTAMSIGADGWERVAEARGPVREVVLLFAR